LLPFGITDLEFSIVTFISAFVGISIIISSSKWITTRLLAAFAVGVYLWYFTDTLGGANYLGLVNGFALSTDTFSLLLLFAIGLGIFFGLDGGLFTGESPNTKGIFLALLAAVALGLHGMAEGEAFGASAASTPFNTLLDAFGGWAPSASWVMHKMLEPTVAAAGYVALTGNAGKSISEKLYDALALSAAFVTPAIVGSIIGYYAPFDNSYLYALGLGTSVYALARVTKALYAPSTDQQNLLSLKVAAAVFLGFLFIFISALLHA
jgi:hypothetical protein